MSDLKTSLEIIAPSIEEAIRRGSQELGLPEDAFDVEVLDQGSKGLFGLGSRQLRVRLTVKEPQTIEAISPPETESRQPTSDEDDEALRITKDTVAELLLRMGLHAEVQGRWGEATTPSGIRPLLIDVHGKDLSILIGRRGETLSALQYITRLIVGKELHKPIAVVIDVEGYRARREQQLRRLARRMAQQTIERGRTMSLEPMPANERRIIHIELREHSQVYTESVGEGEKRKVTIIPRDR
ncbi:MAG: RNA-binding cell elongation regulator Jag/EloR [Anaerolineales bacterium]|jgi:spoIIIJ-associated protein